MILYTFKDMYTYVAMGILENVWSYRGPFLNEVMINVEERL